jgi:hypothetical protein
LIGIIYPKYKKYINGECLFAYEESRVYKKNYEEVFYKTIKVLRSSGCHIKAADFKAGIIFATYGGFFRDNVDWPNRAYTLEYIWVLFTHDDTFTEIKMKSGRAILGDQDFKWEDILYKLDIKIKEHNSYSISQSKIHQKPRSVYSIIAAFINPVFVFLIIYSASYTEVFFYSNFPGNELILLVGGIIIIWGAIFNAIRFYKIGIVLSILGVILLISSLNLIAIALSVWNLYVLRDVWEYSKWNKYATVSM